MRKNTLAAGGTRLRMCIRERGVLGPMGGGEMARGLEAATQVLRHLLPLRMAVLCARSDAVRARQRGGQGQVPPGKTPGGGPEQ